MNKKDIEDILISMKHPNNEEIIDYDSLKNSIIQAGSTLNSEDFIKDNSEAELATKIFGKDKNVGTAQLNFDLISSKE